MRWIACHSRPSNEDIKNSIILIFPNPISLASVLISLLYGLGLQALCRGMTRAFRVGCGLAAWGLIEQIFVAV